MDPAGPTGTRTEKLREVVADAGDEAARLHALLGLARHFAEVSDGVNGLEVAREARRLALARQDWGAAAHALNSASLSQYHRSDYVSALATAMDAWDFARRAGAADAIAESYFTIALALHALGETADAMRVVEKGLAVTARAPDLRAPRVWLVGMKAMLCFDVDDLELTDRYCGEAVALSDGAAPLLSLSHGNWGIALLRAAEHRIEQKGPGGDLVARAREHLEIALALARTEGDARRVADRISLLGQAALLEGREGDAERLLADAMRRSLALDYVRAAVSSAHYLARLFLARGEVARAVEVLKTAETQARRGVPVDVLPLVKGLLADALERQGSHGEADAARTAAAELREANRVHRSRAVEDARRLAARVLGGDAGA